MSIDLVCECGHLQSEHVEIAEADMFWCSGCDNDDVEHFFKADNLRTLENLSEHDHSS